MQNQFAKPLAVKMSLLPASVGASARRGSAPAGHVGLTP